MTIEKEADDYAASKFSPNDKWELYTAAVNAYIAGAASNSPGGAGVQQIIENVLGVGSPWPLKDVLNKLIEAAGILLDKKNYDGHGWEEIHHRTVIGKQIVEKISGENLDSITPSVKEDGKDKRIEELENGFRLLQTYQLSPTLERIIDKTLNKL